MRPPGVALCIMFCALSRLAWWRARGLLTDTLVMIVSLAVDGTRMQQRVTWRVGRSTVWAKDAVPLVVMLMLWERSQTTSSPPCWRTTVTRSPARALVVWVGADGVWIRLWVTRTAAQVLVV